VTRGEGGALRAPPSDRLRVEQPIDARPTHVSPDETLVAARKLSVPGVFLARRRTVNEPLGALVTRLPAKIRSPFCRIRTRHV
jgi:hypothetical protein